MTLPFLGYEILENGCWFYKGTLDENNKDLSMTGLAKITGIGRTSCYRILMGVQ